MSSSLDYLDLCRLCLVKDRVSVPIFEDEGDVRQIFLKITACLPVKVSREDKLPKKLCDDCVYKVELFYQFWNTTANAEKQLLQWLGEVGGLEDKQGYVTEVLDTNVMKQERSSDSRLDGNVMQVGGHQNSMDMGMMDIITLPAGSETQFTSVPMDTSGTVQTVQVVPGPSTQTTHDQLAQGQSSHLVGEESEEDNSDDGCDNEEGLPVKEEHDEDQGDPSLEPTTFVALPCDEAGPSGLQQQKISDITEMSMQQTADNDPKTGRGHSRWTRKQSIISRIRVRASLELFDSCPSPALMDEDPLYRPPSKSKTMPKRKGSKPSKTHKKKDSESEHVAEYDSECEQKSDDSVKSPKKSHLKEPKLNKTSNKKVASKSGSSNEKSEEAKQKKRDIKNLSLKLKSGDFACKLCSETFSHRFKVSSHIRAKHQPRQVFQCPECPHSYKSNYQLKTHMNIHRENKSDFMFFCDKCDYRALTKNYLKCHEIRKHSNEYPFECDHCKKRFKIKMDLKFHLGTHSDARHMCDICGKMYSSPESLYKHRRVMHLNEYKFKCPKCWQKLLSQESLDQHLEKHKVLHSCDECELKFTKKYYLTRHKKRVHKVEKNNLCPVCGKSFVCMATLRVHYLTHAKVKPYMCNVCGFSFTQRSSMMLHWKRKHPDAAAPPPPVILTNFFDSISSEVQNLVEPTLESSSENLLPGDGENQLYQPMDMNSFAPIK